MSKLTNDILFGFLHAKKEEQRRVTRGIRTLKGWVVFTDEGSELIQRPLPEAKQYARTINARLIKAVYQPVA